MNILYQVSHAGRGWKLSGRFKLSNINIYFVMKYKVKRTINNGIESIISRVGTMPSIVPFLPEPFGHTSLHLPE